MGCASCKPIIKGSQNRSNVITYPSSISGITFFEPEPAHQPEPVVSETQNNIVPVPRKITVHTNLGPGEFPDKNIILFWKSARKTERYHWWPLLNRDIQQEDPVNNLFARGGGIHKYATLCDNLALDYQKTYHCIPPDSERSDKNWAGFCDRASTLSCLFSYPRRSVTAKFGPRQVEFMPEDIEALMICASDNAIRQGKTVFYGKRNNIKKKDDDKISPNQLRLIKSEPLPLDLLDILQSLTRELIPFVMDVDNGAAVWNYPFDSVIINLESPEKYQKYLPNKGENKIYRFLLTSTAYPEKNMDLVGYVNKYHNFIDQGWIGDKNPDFLWRQYPQEGPWIGKSEMNPYINCYHVYRIYQESLCLENKIVKLTP